MSVVKIFPAAERQSGYRQCAGHRRLAIPAAPASARNAAAADHQLQRLERPDSATRHLRQRALRRAPQRSGLNFLRTQLVTVPGAVVPYPYGGKQRQVMINMNAGLLQSKGLSPQDLLNAVNLQSLVLPSGTAKIGPTEYDVRLNDSPRTDRGIGRPARQARQRHHHLSARRGHRRRRLRAANQYRAAGRAPRRAGHHRQIGNGVHAGRRLGHPPPDPARGDHIASAS